LQEFRENKLQALSLAGNRRFWQNSQRGDRRSLEEALTFVVTPTSHREHEPNTDAFVCLNAKVQGMRAGLSFEFRNSSRFDDGLLTVMVFDSRRSGWRFWPGPVV
jgi:hypothetical protein